MPFKAGIAETILGGQGGSPVGRVYVIQAPWLTKAIIESLRRSLQALGFELVILALEECETVVSGDTVLVLIDDALNSGGEISAGIEKALTHGARVIGVWPPGQELGKLPAVIARRGSGATTCDEPGLRSVVGSSGGGGETWLEPSGQSMPERPLKRGGC